MALEAAEWGAVAGVFVIVVTMMVYNQLAAKRTAGRTTASTDGPAAGNGNVTDHLSRFVVHDGDVVGEVVARDGDDLIVKHQGHYRCVPVASTRIANDEVHVHGEMDWDEAGKRGDAWLARNSKGQDDAITPELTKSEDVKRPAFEAFRQRTGGDSEEE